MSARAETSIKDVVVWIKHVHGDRRVTERLQALKGGDDLELVVDGVRGVWRKMSDGVDGRPTPGVKPVGRMRDFWKELYEARRGGTVVIELPESDDGAGALVYPAHPDPAARQAALAALLGAGGGRAEGRVMTRDEMHER